MSVRQVDDMDAGDVAVGQVWRHMVVQLADRKDWTVRRVNSDGSVVVVRGEAEDVIPVGVLLADWVLIAEAP